MTFVKYSAMSKVEPPDDLPNGDESAFGPDETAHENGAETDDDPEDEDAMHVSESVPIPANVFMATSHGLLTPVTAEQLHEAGIKTTHIVIHDETLEVATDALKTPTTPLPPPTPSTPLSKERGFRYQWDDSAFDSILPVRCKNSNGEFHKSRFGSGGRGRCIKMEGSWYTPSEFEAVCGRASSKDWKRSIRYGGRTLSCLIDDGILLPHATSCTCAACCDDEAVTGPVRLFQPYKRRKRDSGEMTMRKKSLSSKPLTASPGKDPVVALSGTVQAVRVTAADTATADNIQILTAAGDGTGILTDQTMVITPQGAKTNTGVPSLTDQKIWWQLEEMANNLIQQAQQLKTLIESARQHSQISHDTSILQYKNQLEKEKNDALHAMRIDAQMQVSRAILDERAQKDIAVQQALAQARVDMQEKIDTLSHINTRHDSSDKVDTVTVTDDKNTVVYLWPAQSMDSTDGTEQDPLDKDKG